MRHNFDTKIAPIYTAGLRMHMLCTNFPPTKHLLYGISYSQKFSLELIFETFKNPVTLLKIKILNGTLYIGIDIRRTQFFILEHSSHMVSIYIKQVNAYNITSGKLG